VNKDVNPGGREMARFGGYVVIMDLAILLLAGLPLYYFSGLELFLPVPLALGITTFLAIASFYPFTRMSGGSMSRYMTAMLLAMFIRMIIIGASVVVVFVFTELHQISFTVALLFSYICKSAFETFILTR
jgi:hypothetical protein